MAIISDFGTNPLEGCALKALRGLKHPANLRNSSFRRQYTHPKADCSFMVYAQAQ